MTRPFEIGSVIAALKSVIGPTQGPVALHEPSLDGNEIRYATECISSGWVSSVGSFVDEFERRLSAITGAKRAVAVVNGTAALHVALLLAGVRPGDEVLVPALTFVATANAVAYCGAVPHLVDSDAATLGLDPRKLDAYLKEHTTSRGGARVNSSTNRRIAAVVPMHTFGHPVDLDALAEVCARFEIPMVEDAAEALGSRIRGRHVGTWGRLSIISFNGNKIVTTGGGGAILTNDEALGRRAKHLTTTARRPHPWLYEHDEIGYNYRMPNLNAALGCAQLEKLDSFVERKRALAAGYQHAFADMEGIRVFREPDFATSNYWLNALLLDPENAVHRDGILRAAHQEGVLARPAWTLLHRLAIYADCPRMDLSCAEDLQRRLINVPSSAALSRTKLVATS